MKQTVVLGVTGGIAGYKTLELIKLLKNKKIDVHVIMTASATKMFSISDFEKASGNKVYTELFEKDFDYKQVLKNKKVDHIELANKADLFVIAPATANIISKIANGIADDFLTTTLLATKCLVLICPSMNCNMWENPIVKENVLKLTCPQCLTQGVCRRESYNYHFIEPATGHLACGINGIGRLENIQIIFDKTIKLLNQTQDFKGKKILITAGGTSEPIDLVRVITNKSSGKMGARIAEQAFLRGAKVILLRSINSVKPNYAIQEELFTDSASLSNQIKKYITDVDIIIHAAAVSDFASRSLGEVGYAKIKSSSKISIELFPTEKIINKLKQLNPKIFLVGFKAEVNASEKELIDSAFELLQKANADLIVANDVGKKDVGFNADSNEVILVDKQKRVEKIPLASKQIVADKILDRIKMNFSLSS